MSIKDLARILIAAGIVIISAAGTSKAIDYVEKEAFVAGFISGAGDVLLQMTGGQIQVDPVKAREYAIKKFESKDKK